MNFRQQIGGIIMAFVTFCVIMLVLLLTGCVSTRGIEEISFGIPTLLMLELEYNEEADTSLDVGLPLGFDGLPLTAAPVEQIVPVEP